MPHGPASTGLAPLVGAIMVSSGLVPSLLADGTVRWRLSATIPVVCSVTEVIRDPDDATQLAVQTSCNAQTYSLVVRAREGVAEVRAARSADVRAVVRGGAVEITSVRPGPALITLELAAPVDTAGLSVALRPL